MTRPVLPIRQNNRLGPDVAPCGPSLPEGVGPLEAPVSRGPLSGWKHYPRGNPHPHAQTATPAPRGARHKRSGQEVAEVAEALRWRGHPIVTGSGCAGGAVPAGLRRTKSMGGTL